MKNSEKGNTYAGKRFLGLTPRGGEVWISMELDKVKKDLSINTTHNLNILLEEGAEPAKKRVTLKKGVTSFYSTEDLIRRNQRNMGGEVTEATITSPTWAYRRLEPKTLMHCKRLAPLLSATVKNVSC